MAFLLLLAKLSLYAAELNPVLSRNLYPRALPLGGEPTEADLQVLSQLVHQEKRREDQAIGVGFGDDAAEDAAADAERDGQSAVADPALELAAGGQLEELGQLAVGHGRPQGDARPGQQGAVDGAARDEGGHPDRVGHRAGGRRWRR